MPTTTQQKTNYKSKDIINQLVSKWQYGIEYNTVLGCIEINGEPLTDPIAATINKEFDDIGWRRTRQIWDAILSYAYKNSYHPILRYFQDLQPWDGKDYYKDFTDCIDDPTGRTFTYLKKYLIGCIAKSYGRTQNRTLILDGRQFIGKSTLVEKLVPPTLRQYHSNASINPDDKDSVLRLASMWICELPEFGSVTRRADREALKAFLTREHITIRKPYGRYDQKFPVLANFVATVNNESGILNDLTGSRRFIVLHMNDIDYKGYSQVPIDSLWSQLYAEYLDESNGLPWELTTKEYEESELYNRENYEEPNTLEDILLEKYTFDPNSPHLYETFISILDYVKSTNYKYSTENSLAKTVIATLKRLGSIPAKKWINNRQFRCWTGIHK